MARNGSYGKILFFVFCLSFLTGCSKPQAAPTPQEVLQSYLEAFFLNQKGEMELYLQDGDRPSSLNNNYHQSLEEKFIRRQLANTVSYSVTQVVISQNHATAYVEITAPDFALMLRSILDSVALNRFPAGNLEGFAYTSDVIMKYVKKYGGEGMPGKTSTEVFHLVRNDKAEWKIVRKRRLPGQMSVYPAPSVSESNSGIE